jgi:hypothetical protein
MSTRGVLRHFGAYRAERIIWIDDSSCIVAFPDEECVTQVFENLPVRKFDKESNTAVKALGYYHNEEEIPLFIRYATSTDTKPEGKKYSKYYQWLNSQKRKSGNRRDKRRARKEDDS